MYLCPMQNIIVASKNPVKIQAARSGFEAMFKAAFQTKGCSVTSGVSDQPMSSAETLQGAKNRAKNAQLAYPIADFWVGIEGGIEAVGNTDMEAFAWIVILSKNQMGKAKTASFFLPPAITALIRTGMELGDADDQVFGDSNSKQKNGAVGLLTGDVMTRTGLYEEAIKLALIPFKNSNLYPLVHEI